MDVLQQGTADDPGINQRALNELFSITQSRTLGSKTGAETFRIVVSIFEIHNESVYDLLVDNPHSERYPFHPLSLSLSLSLSFDMDSACRPSPSSFSPR